MNAIAYGDLTLDNPTDEMPEEISGGNDGLLTRTRHIIVRTLTPEAYIVYDSPHPDDEDFLLTSVQGSKPAPQVWRFSLTYTGAADPAPGKDAVETYQYNTDTAISPIETHPDIDELKAFAYLDDDGNFKAWNPALADPRYLTGITSYYDPRMTYVRTLVMDQPDDYLTDIASDYFELAKIFATPPGSVPTIGVSYDWLLIRATIDVIGGALRIQQHFQLSGPNGWNTDIYYAAS